MWCKTLSNNFVIISDSYLLAGFEIGLLLIFFVAFFIDFNNRNNTFIALKRGEHSLKKIQNFFNLSSLFVIYSVIEVSSAYENYKVALLIFNYVVWLYLVYFNGWFRNKIIGYTHLFEELDEKG